MKLYTGMGPNPRTVRIFMAEKGIELPLEQVDLVGGENSPYIWIRTGTDSWEFFDRHLKPIGTNADEAGWASLFNGRNLDGWVVKCLR